MGDQPPPNQMNLDLNLGPVDVNSLPDYTSLDDWLEEPIRRIRQAITQRSAFRRMPSLWREPEWDPRRYTLATRPIALDLINENGIETGQGSVTAEERPTDEAKACDNNNGFLEESSFGKKESLENGNGSEGSIFGCNICLDLAKDPVVTCCGHLFCWPCLYRWLNVHSDAEECPVCKGEVNVKNVTPIYGGGSDNRAVEIDSSSLKIPPRPKARRVESWRQTLQRNRRSIPLDELDEMILQGEVEFGSTRHSVRAHSPNNTRELPNNNLSSLLLVSQEIQRERNSAAQRTDPVDLNRPYVDSTTRPADSGETRVRSSLLHRRTRTHRVATLSSLTTTLSSYDRITGSYFLSHQEQPAPVDDRDSVSSIAGVIQSESQTVDTAMEIDSRVSRSTLSSRRRNESRVSDVDSGESRAPRRRRLH